MNRKLNYIFLLFLMLGMASCDTDLLNDDEALSMSLDKITFDEGYKTFAIEGSLTNDSLWYDLCDSAHTTLSVYSCTDYFDTIPADVTGEIKEVRNISKEQFLSMGMQAMVIVDRTMEQPLVDNARNAVMQLSRFLRTEDIYVSFLDSKGALSTTEALSPDIFSQDFVSSSIDGKDKYLYRAIYRKLEEATQPGNVFTGDNHFLLVITDGIVWDEDKPYDPDHFIWQQNLLNLTNLTLDKCPIFYTLMTDEFGMPLDVNNTMKSVCERTQGACYDISNPDAIHQAICEAHFLPHIDYRFLLEFPDDRMLCGEHINLYIDAIQDGETRMHSFIDYQKGSWFLPIIVNGMSTKDMLIKCIIIGALLILIVYLILQLLVPYIQNKLFERKYMAEYTGPNMSVAGRQVPEVCYFCKTPFQPGDKIVASCEHAMHQECWEENGCKCPEHGITCKEDVHYANPKTRFARTNAPYYMSWVLVALLANIVRTVLKLVVSGEFQQSVLHSLANVFMTEEMAAQTTEFCYRNSHNTGVLAMCIVAAIAYKCRRHVPVKKQVLEIALRSFVAYLAGYMIIFLDNTVCTLFDIQYYQELIGVTSYLLVLASVYAIISFRSPIRLNMNKLMAVGVLVLAVGYFIAHNFYFDQRELYFYVFGAVYVAIALSVAFDTRRTWHCFLRVEGTMKKIEVAMFKWFVARTGVSVTLGRSVDCSIQITWDAKNKIAPVQAEIREHHGILCLFPTEEGVMDHHGASLPAEKPYKLYHGTRFKIGDLIFTYLEKY